MDARVIAERKGQALQQIELGLAELSGKGLGVPAAMTLKNTNSDPALAELQRLELIANLVQLLLGLERPVRSGAAARQVKA